jgi:hypothetical protein
LIVFLAAHLLAPRLTQILPFFWSCPMHSTHDTRFGPRRATPANTVSYISGWKARALAAVVAEDIVLIAAGAVRAS